MKPRVQRLKAKILSQKSLVAKFGRQKRKNKKLVFTNGCFDILHPGHVIYLEKAREKGDILVVALDTDVSVRKLKGPARPVNDLNSRMTVLASLASVDAVTWFDGSDPRPLIKKISPDVLVKGGDWKPNSILGHQEVSSWGGKTFSIPLVAGKSTTKIVEKIQNEKRVKK